MDGMERLAEEAAADLEVAFPLIVVEYGPAIYTTALRLSVQPADAEDLAADTFARAYRALANYPPERIQELRLRPWLVTIALNLWRNRLRSASRRPAMVPLDDSAILADPAGDPERAAIDGGGSEAIRDRLAVLPEMQRLSILLYHVVGLSYAEIVTALDCPAGTVKSHVSRGLATLRTKLHPNEEAMS